MNKLEADWEKCRAVAVPALTDGEDPATADILEYAMRQAFHLGAQSLFARLGEAIRTGNTLAVQQFLASTTGELAAWQSEVSDSARQSLADPSTGCPRCSHALDNLGTVNRCPRCYHTQPR